MALLDLPERLVDYAAYRVRKSLFDSAVRSVYATEPIVCDPASRVVMMSQCRHSDVAMYLIAVKSFARFLRPKRFAIVDDGLSPQDRGMIEAHIDAVDFLAASDIDVAPCPRGGCWERLVAISRRCVADYVIQLDSDTVTIDKPHEVLDCVAANRCFTMGTKLGREVMSAADASRLAKTLDGTEVQILAERVLGDLSDASSRRYVRGCAAFAGFSVGSITGRAIAEFSLLMEQRLGSRVWHSWGSEQFTSNYLVANTDEPLVLPFDRYPYWAPGRDVTPARLIHFIGQHRFHGGEYARHARTFIRATS